MSPKYDEVKNELLKKINLSPFTLNDVDLFMHKIKLIQMKKQWVINSSVLVVAYKWDEDGVILYGASRFKKLTKKEHFDKKVHRETALSRLKKVPVQIQVNPSQLARCVREKEIRRAIHYQGCGCKPG